MRSSRLPVSRTGLRRRWAGRAGSRRAMVLEGLLRDEVEVGLGEDEVHEEQEDDRDHDSLVDGVAHPLGTPLAVETLVVGDGGCQEAEQEGLEERQPEV